jgi:multiple sugar transport system permease protein
MLQNNNNALTVIRGGKKHFLYHCWIYLFLVVIAFTMLIHFAWMLSSSLKLNREVFTFPMKWIPEIPRWKNYSDIWTKIPLGIFILNTVKLSVIATLLQLLTSSFAAYAFAKLRFPGCRAFFWDISPPLPYPALIWFPSSF